MRVLRCSLLTLVLVRASNVAAACPELLENNEFSSGGYSPWFVDGLAVMSAGVSADSYQTLNVTVYPDALYPLLSEALLSQPVSVVKGAKYRLSFWATSDVPIRAQVKVGDSSDPYTPYGLDSYAMIPSGSGATQSFTFTATATDATAGLVIMFGAEYASVKFDSLFMQDISSPDCDDGTGGSGNGGSGAKGGSGNGGGNAKGGTSGSGGTRSAGGATGRGGTSAVVTGARIRANQVGYIPRAEKLATVEHGSTAALDWQLVDSSGVVVAEGVTKPVGKDAISGNSVHLLDFSAYTKKGTGLRLEVGDAKSPSFSIGGDAFGALRRDALRFFYHQRASSAIVMPYAEESQWERARGHADTSVSCRSGTGCSYRLDVSRGWYDAGDYGKYVVNGGISAWTLMNLYERAKHLGTGTTPLDDGTTNIPEGSNGVSDLLDEVRWELEFLLKMQVPKGNPLAGMVHHKLHGTAWPAIPTEPAADATGRVLSAPSTAATLNLAAVAAQCARVFSDVDPDFAAQCRAAAEAAYEAAVAHPAVYAVNTPEAGDEDGGGAYDDGDVSDEFYWAQAELYITTGEAGYRDSLLASPHHATAVTEGGPFSWRSTALAGALSLTVVPNKLSRSAVAAVRTAITDTADAYRLTAAKGYGTPIREYSWGSNSDVLNSALVLAVAYDLTGSTAYRRAALSSLDYVLGRNPLGQCYVTNYGSTAFQNAHHRFFAHAFSSLSPVPPPGFVAGGPNENLDGLEFPGTLSGCVGPKCWRDDAEAYGLTEVAINWNAPLAWIAAWASEQEIDPKSEFPLSGVGGGGGTSGSGGATAVGAGGAAEVAGADPGGAAGTAGADAGGEVAGRSSDGGNGGADGGSDRDGGAAGLAGDDVDAGGDNAAAGATGSPEGGQRDSGGCGCHVGGGTPPVTWLMVFAPMMARLLRRRRRSR